MLINNKVRIFLIFFAYALALINYFLLVNAIMSSAELTSTNIFLLSLKGLIQQNINNPLWLIFIINLSTLFLASILLFFSLIFRKAKSFGINNEQINKLHLYKSRGFFVKNKNPILGAFLALLPAGASIYLHHFLFGIISVLTYPFSICWEVVIGYFGSLKANYTSTHELIKQTHSQQEKQLDDLLINITDNGKSYILAKKELDKKYSDII